jgi:hypothetical protein
MCSIVCKETLHNKTLKTGKVNMEIIKIERKTSSINEDIYQVDTTFTNDELFNDILQVDNNNGGNNLINLVVEELKNYLDEQYDNYYDSWEASNKNSKINFSFNLNISKE